MEIPEKLISTLQNAKRVLVLTGAGMSAESGVPTFRDAQAGLWQKYRPEELATPQAFSRIQQVKPHAGHLALVEIEQYFEQLLIVTQNVDGLHQVAGSGNVVELHGNIMRTVCSLTGKEIGQEWLKHHPGNPPVSPHHPDGLARPAVVWFGEALPEQAMNMAIEQATTCDVCFSIGTSSLVQPAASVPYLALESGASLIEINPLPTPLSASANFNLYSSAAEALTAIAAELGRQH
jgi:NAD-dependent deacetylase